METPEQSTPESTPQPPPPPIQSLSPSEKEDRNWAMAMPLGAALTTIFGGHTVLLPIIVPLVIWLIKKETSPLCNEVGKETLNAQISYLIYVIVSALLCFILIGFPLLIGVLLLDLICSIIAAVKAAEGTVYRYPAIIRFIK